MSAIDRIVGALTRQGLDDPLDVAAKIYGAAWVVAGFLAFVALLGTVSGAAQ